MRAMDGQEDTCDRCTGYRDSTKVPWVVRAELRGEKFEAMTDPSWVDSAKRLLRRVPHPVCCVPTSRFRHLPRYPKNEYTGEYARPVPNVKVPVILAQKDGVAIVWDGAHRVAEAAKLRVPVRYVLLSEKESVRIAEREGLSGDDGRFIPRQLAPVDGTILVKDLGSDGG